MPRLAVINAAGANTLYELYERRGLRWNDGRPDASIVNNYYAELDDAIAARFDDRQRDRDQSAGEPEQVPAGARVLRRRGARGDRPGDARRQGPGRRGRPGLRAGQRRQRRRGQSCCAKKASSRPSERVVCILTGHQLKDPTATVAYHTTDQDSSTTCSAAAA